MADDPADATAYVGRLIDQAGGQRVVKRKSMTTEKLELNEGIEGIGADVVETDLGEWIVQLANESPSHIVAPANHRSRGEIADVLNEPFATDEPLETAEELTRFARDRLAEEIRTADVGVTGANFITANSGSTAGDERG